MTPARDFTIEDHGFPISPEQALKLLRGRLGDYSQTHSFIRLDTPWLKRRRVLCLNIAWDHLLNIHAELGIDRLHLGVRNHRVQYPTVELITTHRSWWDQPWEFLQEYGRSNGHGERDVGFGAPIYSYTVDFRYFSEIPDGEWDTFSKQRIGEPIRYLTRPSRDPW